MMIVDSHVHIFETITGMRFGQPLVSLKNGKIRMANQEIYFLPPTFADTNSPSEMLIAHMDHYGVEKAVLVPNIVYGYHNKYNIETVQKHPEKLRALALTDITKSTGANELEKLLKLPEFCGLKIEVESAFQFAPQTMLDDIELQRIWEVCDGEGAVVMLHLQRPEDIISMKGITAQYKNIKYIFCHMGAEAVFAGETKKKHTDDALTEIVMSNENAWYELSSLPLNLANEYYPFVQAERYLRKKYDRVGAEKIIWGSDYPGMLNRGTYKQLIDFVLKDSKGIPEYAIKKIMGENAEELFFN